MDRRNLTGAHTMKGNDLKRRQSAAFTLLEMMLVVAIIGILMSVAVWNIVGQGEKARIRATHQSMRVIESALKAYKTDTGAYPTNLQSLVTAKFMEDNFKDAWKHDIEYRTPGLNGKDYTLISAGPDGQTGTEDDLDIFRLNEQQ